jgi:hypothetical protein
MQIKPRPVITTRNLHEHTAQEVFDFVCLKVLEQGKPSYRGGACAYRGEDGLKCAVGHLIEDDAFAAELDKRTLGVAVGMFNTEDFERLGWRGPAHLKLLSELQVAHDCAGDHEFVSGFSGAARDIARKFHLDPHILDAAVPA